MSETTEQDKPSEESGSFAPGLKICYELALRRFDFVDRAFDTVNGRLAALIALNGFLVPATKAVMVDLKQTAAGTSAWFGLTMLALVSAQFVCCVAGYKLARFQSLGDPVAILNKNATLSEDELRSQLLPTISETTDHNNNALDRKRRFFDVALFAFAASWIAIALFSVVAYR